MIKSSLVQPAPTSIFRFLAAALIVGFTILPTGAAATAFASKPGSQNLSSDDQAEPDNGPAVEDADLVEDEYEGQAEGQAEGEDSIQEIMDESDEAASIDTSGPPPAPTTSIAPRIRRAQGLVFRLEGGQAMWRLDAEQIESQVPPNLRNDVQNVLVERTHNAPSLTLHLGYNVLGHATLGAELAATGWNLFDSRRGGGGMAAVTFSWHPAELLAELLPIGLLRQRAWDVSLLGGAGWGAVGKDHAVRGMHIVIGARAEIYVADWLAIGASLKRYNLRFSEYVTHWDNNQFVTLEDTSGGSLLLPGLAVILRVPTDS